jgi:hypothetical protein
MAPSSNHSSTPPQLTTGKELSDEINLVDGMLPELTEDLDSEYVIIENSEAESGDLPLDHLTIYDGLLYEERAASTKPIAELRSQLRSKKNSGDASELILTSPPIAEEYERLRNLRQISRQLETDIHPLVATETRKCTGNSGIDWATKDKKIPPQLNTSREVFSMDDKAEGKLHSTWEESVENVKTGTSGAILSDESFEE